MTIVELLVVIAIIGILIALMLPAVQAAREAARRMQCLNNVKNIALAIHNYHDSYKCFPAGSKNANYLTWVHFTLPYCEQQAAYDRLNFDGPLIMPGSGGGKYDAMAHDDSWDNKYLFADVRFKLHSCPSDVNGDSNRSPCVTYPFVEISNLKMKLYSYVACAGNTALYGVESGEHNKKHPRGWVPEYHGVKHGGACFGMTRDTNESLEAMSAFPAKAWVLISEVRDGLSNTMLISESIQAEQPGDGDDLRGMTAWGPTAMFTAFIGPNSKEADRLLGTAYCNNLPYQPCEGPDRVDGVAVSRIGARSRHPGGVNVGKADGSVSYFANSVDLGLWQALSTANGGETASSP